MILMTTKDTRPPQEIDETPTIIYNDGIDGSFLLYIFQKILLIDSEFMHRRKYQIEKDWKRKKKENVKSA